MTVGDRMEEALRLADMTVRDLEEALTAEGVRGGSYANLHRLKSDKLKRPSAGLLHAIADATEVDPEWLVTGQGEPTEAREKERHEADTLTRDMTSGTPDYVLQEIRRAFDQDTDPKRSRLPDSTPFARAVLFQAWRTRRHALYRRTVDRQPGGRDVREVELRAAATITDQRSAERGEMVAAEDKAAAHQVGRAARRLLDALEVDLRSMDDSAWDGLALSVLQAIRATADVPTLEPQRSRPEPEED